MHLFGSEGMLIHAVAYVNKLDDKDDLKTNKSQWCEGMTGLTFPPPHLLESLWVPNTGQSAPETNMTDTYEDAVQIKLFRSTIRTVYLLYIPGISHTPQAWKTWTPQLEGRSESSVTVNPLYQHWKSNIFSFMKGTVTKKGGSSHPWWGVWGHWRALPRRSTATWPLRTEQTYT